MMVELKDLQRINDLNGQLERAIRIKQKIQKSDATHCTIELKTSDITLIGMQDLSDYVAADDVREFLLKGFDRIIDQCMANLNELGVTCNADGNANTTVCAEEPLEPTI
jgi:rRNA processing protein Krr1/Pno1